MSRANEEAAFTIGESYVVRRCRSHQFGGEEFQLGGQAGWFWGLPGVFHALASSKTGQPIPAAPRPTPDEAHSQSLGYWCALQYLLLYRLGWSNPRKGLMQWYDKGKPTDDPTLALVAEIWDRDGHLDVYLAWLLQNQPRFLGEGRQNGASWPEVPEPIDPAWSAWLRKTSTSLESSPAPHFSLTGGCDSLHLTVHVGEGGQADPKSSLSVVDAKMNRAIFTTDTNDAWYWDLRTKAMKLPTSAHSWRIDVFVRPVGFIGNYRLSRTTSLLFSGRHRYHSMGN